MKRSTLLLAVFTPAALYLATTSAIANSLAKLQPDIAMTMPVANGPAMARSARQDIARALQANATKGAKEGVANPFPAAVENSIASKALAAFLSEPLSTEAIMPLGLTANGRSEKAKARSIFRASAALSRREEVAALWLARDAAENNDIDEMLKRFDQILRTSQEARPILLEQFAAATTDRQFHRGMVELLSSHPVWEADFWETAPKVEAAARSVGELRLALVGRNAKVSEQADVRIAYNLINQGEFALASQLFAKLAGVPASEAIVKNADFSNPSRFAPVDWQTYSTADFGSEISTSNGLLYLYATDAPGGGVARQWVSLSPGRYRLRATVRGFGMEEGDSLSAQLSCISSGDAKQTFPLSDGSNEIEFAIGATCRQFWLDVVAKPAERNPGFEAEIERLTLERQAA